MTAQPGAGWAALWAEVGTSGTGALATVLTTTVLYLLAMALFKAHGQRLYASPSSREVAVTVVIGAIVGRTMLGPRPTLTVGLLALATLLVLEVTLRGLSRHEAWAARAGAAPGRAVVLMAGPHPRRAELRRFGLSERDLWVALRRQGIGRVEDVALVVLERGGTLSVLRREDAGIDRQVLEGVRDLASVPPGLLAPGDEP